MFKSDHFHDFGMTSGLGGLIVGVSAQSQSAVAMRFGTCLASISSHVCPGAATASRTKDGEGLFLAFSFHGAEESVP